jgi:hypothetical protein
MKIIERVVSVVSWALSARGTPPCQIPTNDLYGDPSIRRRQTTASKQLQ